MANTSRNPTDLLRNIGQFRETKPFVLFWVAVWEDSELFLVVVPLLIWSIIGIICVVALVFQRVFWISRFSGVGTGNSGHNLQSLPEVLNPNLVWALAIIASSMNVSYYYAISTLWANTDTAFNNSEAFIWQICASITTAIFVLVTTFTSSISLFECMNYRDSAHKPPEPDSIPSLKKNPTHQQVAKKRSLWAEEGISAELAGGDLTWTAPFRSNPQREVTHHNTATNREIVSSDVAKKHLSTNILTTLYQAVVATFSVVCAISSALTDISIFDLISYAKIELVIATNFELVWKDEINSLGQSQRCFGNMQAHENVFKSFSFRDTMTFCGLVIAFNWIATACKVFVEFSQGPDLPSRLVNEVGSASFITTAAVAIMIFLKLAFFTLRFVSNTLIFGGYLLTADSNPYLSAPHFACLPVIG
jgi:hypothetical protein